MASEEPLRHEERPHPGTRVLYTLTGDGLAIEEYTSGVKTHDEIVYYDEVWDTYRRQDLPWKTGLALLALTLCWCAAPVVVRPEGMLWAGAGALLGAAWGLLIWHALLLVVEVFGYEGNRLALFRGVGGKRFREFLDAFEARLAGSRYPLQSVFESLDLGACEWKGFVRRWSCRFVYDRVIIHRRGWFGRETRVYYALMGLEPPLRLAWRVPWLPLGAAAALGAFAAAISWEAGMGPDPSLWRMAGFLWAALAADLLLCALFLSVSVQIHVGAQAVRSPAIPWWQKRQRQEILKWFSRLTRLADKVSVLDTEDYWEYHRGKLAILREEGFLGDWAYHSAVARLNSQEREDLGE